MSMEEKMNPVGGELIAKENIDEVVERIEALSASAGALMERSVDAFVSRPRSRCPTMALEWPRLHELGQCP